MSSITTHKVKLTEDHLKRVSRTSPISAIEELIWNSLDADATEISFRINDNPLGGNLSITLEDNGTGVTHKQVNNFISSLGLSWKSKKHETDSGRPIHGEKGEGRFKAFSLGRVTDWESIYKQGDDFYRLEVKFKSDALNQFEVVPPIKLDNPPTSTGLKVSISELEKKIAGNKFLDLENQLLQSFGSYLYNYSNIKLWVNGNQLDVTNAIKNLTDIPIEVDEIAGVHNLKIIEWINLSTKQLLLCKDNGTVIKELPNGVKKVKNFGYSFTAHLISSLVNEFNNESAIDLFELDNEGKALLDQATIKLNQHFKEIKEQENFERLQRWKNEGIYPFEEQEDMGSIEIAKREIFDIIASKVEDSLPKFEKVDNQTKKFTFQLLSQAIQENPQSMQKIMTEVLNLKQDEQDDFAKLLNKTTLPSVIKSAKVVADRLDFLEALETLVFDFKQSLLERDQLHKILENEAWVFDEYFDLAGSEKRLEDALAIHLKLLGSREDTDVTTPVEVGEDKTGRIDLMLSKAVASKAGQKDFLVVELKRPNKKIDDDVISQIKKYAIAVQEDERFDTNKCNWKFIAVSNSMDKFAIKTANEKGRPSGCVYLGDRIEVYVMTWAEVIGNAKTRLKFYQEQLQYEANEESSKEYLQAMHNKFIPAPLQKQ